MTRSAFKKLSFFLVAIVLSGTLYLSTTYATLAPGTPPPSGGYDSGTNSILDPGCTPTDTDCFVKTGFRIGEPVINGTARQVIYTDNSGNVFSDAEFTRDSVTQETTIGTPISAAYGEPNSQFFIIADATGDTGNVITITFDGVIDVDTAVANWNSANPSNTATVSNGGTYVPSAGTISLSGGGLSQLVTGSLFGGAVQGSGMQTQDTTNNIVSAIATGNMAGFGNGSHGNILLTQDNNNGYISALIQGTQSQNFVVGDITSFSYFSQVRQDSTTTALSFSDTSNDSSLILDTNGLNYITGGITYYLPNGALPNVNDVMTVVSTSGTAAYLGFAPAGGGSGWALLGNSGTTAGTNFIGTTDNQGLVFKTNNTQTGYISNDGGSVGFGFLAGDSASQNQTVFLGIQAGQGATNATGSTFVGYGAGRNAIDSTGALFMGSNAGNGANNADFGVFLGQNAGVDATDAQESNFIGVSAGDTASFANDSNFIGTFTGYQATNSAFSSFLGPYAGYQATNSTQSTFIGYQSGYQAADAAHSIFIGTNTGLGDSVDNTGNINDYSILIGNNTSTGGFSNSIALGANATNTASNQLQIGSTTRTITSVFVGDSKGTASTDSTFFVGFEAGLNATNATNSNFFGINAGNSATNASYSNFLGTSAGNNATNAANSNFFGESAGNSATNADHSNFFGDEAGIGATDATNSNFIGNLAGSGAVNADHSNFFGYTAGQNATNAAYSNFLGASAGFGATNARNSIFIGESAGANDTANNTGDVNDYSILIGNDTSTAGFENSIALGGYATNTASNQFMIGSTTRPIDTTRFQGSVIGTQCTITTGTGIACTSDERLKENIVDLTTGTLDKLMNIRTVNYGLTSDNSHKLQVGFLAQNLEQYFPELVDTDPNSGYKSVYYAQMTPVLVEAIRELNLKVTDFSATNTNQAGLVNIIRGWLADATNGITKIFAGEVETKKLCVSDDSGNKTCITKNQLDTLLSGSPVVVPVQPDPVPTPDPGITDPGTSPEPTPDPGTDDQSPQPDPAPTPDPGLVSPTE